MDTLSENSKSKNCQLININDKWVSENYFNRYQETLK